MSEIERTLMNDKEGQFDNWFINQKRSKKRKENVKGIGTTPRHK